MNSVQSLWNCPSCQTELTLQGKTWSCENKHSFDMAKEGYVNLLLAHHKNSKEPGDNKDMVNARRAFLEQGHYQPLAEKLGQLFSEYCRTLENNNEINFFDAGCGEGYYMHVISQLAQSAEFCCAYSGIDISKNAVLKAAKKYKNNQFAVASTYHLPLQNDSQNAVLQIFAPSSEQEILRVLKSNGVWLTVNPAANHLHQLKQALYDSPTEHKDNSNVPAGFTLQKQINLSFDVSLTTQAARENLLMMTPYYWSATEQKKQQLIQQLQLVTTDFDIRIYQKVSPLQS
ncbi:23S rRNA (guanine(745)-N(1))-methyltransferase [Paraglaciecola aquimarina]|uniref:23S rRNA (Guanine(745)-N(1))-methyltransferase n=1 Tax=Paraglaciecola aquimarina TaxID=1235557 RepID=A0ABU3SVG4_9ALTE|nr:23S rRNA (guanine(745)-N(1))-methyltransferase [Paraglaciecola aquimarina]MDU0354014.1 23S rRNA (guanine(745)-N(1))-methyltransferase [Paraglaciecola aquimarina]